jgi:hypothetical protein
VISPDVRLYTWLDFEDALSQALEAANWRQWFVDARAYWDGATIRIRPGSGHVAKEWLRSVFDPRVLEPDLDLFTHLLIALESVNGAARSLAKDHCAEKEGGDLLVQCRSREFCVRPDARLHGE